MQDRKIEDGPLERRLEELLVAGGDTRMNVDPTLGLNKYGCSPRPRAVTELGSCTSSSPSPLAFQAAEVARRRLVDAAATEGLGPATLAEANGLRRRLARALDVADVPGLDVVLCPSGTDAELIGVLLALGDRRKPLCNLVVAPAEVGGGTSLAAGGLHFNAQVPLRPDPVEIGSSVDPQLSEMVRTVGIVVREEDGRERSDDELDRAFEASAREALSRGERVLLHLVAHSKTGVYAPRLSTLRRLRREFGTADVMVIVDAAQGRLGRPSVASLLEEGLMVIFTGSKFFGGPPFSGAVLVPASAAPAARGVFEMPEGMGAYFTAADLPRGWAPLRTPLAPVGNIGLLLRWNAALAEMEHFQGLATAHKNIIFDAFERLAPQRLASAAGVRVRAVEPMRTSGTDPEHLIERTTTVFPFSMRVPGEEQTLGADELKQVFHLINMDAAALLPDLSPADRAALAHAVHIGQPVALGPKDRGDAAVLRVALGAALVNRIATEDALGPTLDDRLGWLDAELGLLAQKVEAVGRHFRALQRAKLQLAG